MEEERRRNQDVQAETESAQTQLGFSSSSEFNTPKSQVTESPLIDSEPLFDDTSLQIMSGLIQKGKEKFQGNESLKETINDVVFSENPNKIDSPIMQEIEHVLKPLSVKDNIDDPIVDEASPYLLKGEVTKDVLQQNLFEHLRIRVKDFADTGFNKEDDLNLKGELKDRYDKFVNNKTDYSAAMTNKEKLTDKIVQKAFKNLFPSSSDIYTDGMTDFSRARTNPNAEVLQNMDTLDDATKNALLKYGVSSGERGVHYNADSEISKKFANSPEVKKFFEENEEAIKQGTKTGGDFNFNAGLKNLVVGQDKMDRHASLQHAKMIDAYYDENGQNYLINNIKSL